MVHPPHGGLHLKGEGGAVHLMFLELLACISEETAFTPVVGLDEDGPQSGRAGSGQQCGPSIFLEVWAGIFLQ